MFPLYINQISHTSRLKVLIGVGNVLRRDDGIGVYIAERIKERKNLKVINAEVSIENYIGKINAIHADVLIILDSMLCNRTPGYCCLMPVDQVLDFTTNTHNISLKHISEWLDAPVWILGIQPGTVSFGEELTPVVKKTADMIIDLINKS